MLHLEGANQERDAKNREPIRGEGGDSELSGGGVSLLSVCKKPEVVSVYFYLLTYFYFFTLNKWSETLET